MLEVNKNLSKEMSKKKSTEKKTGDKKSKKPKKEKVTEDVDITNETIEKKIKKTKKNKDENVADISNEETNEQNMDKAQIVQPENSNAVPLGRTSQGGNIVSSCWYKQSGQSPLLARTDKKKNNKKTKEDRVINSDENS